MVGLKLEIQFSDVTGEIIRGTGLQCVFGELYNCGELWNKSLCVH